MDANETIEYATVKAVKAILEGDDPFGFAARVSAERRRVLLVNPDADLWAESLAKYDGDVASAVATCATVLACIRINGLVTAALKAA